MRSLGFFGLVGFLPATSLVAQNPDSMAVRAGRWGVDFRIGNGFAGAGALHFTSPTRATLLDVTSAYNHTANTTPGGPTLLASSIGAALSLGRRTYTRVDPRVYRWTTLGLSVAYSRQRIKQGATTQINRGVGTGVFANVGAMWLVTPHLGLGAQWQVDLTYTHAGGSSGNTSDAVTLGLARVALTGQFFF